MTNFDFLKDEQQFAAFSDACIEAEKSIAASPALCALGVRKSAELAVKWLYSVDSSLRLRTRTISPRSSITRPSPPRSMTAS